MNIQFLANLRYIQLLGTNQQLQISTILIICLIYLRVVVVGAVVVGVVVVGTVVVATVVVGCAKSV